jgi:hypothetical protein
MMNVVVRQDREKGKMTSQVDESESHQSPVTTSATRTSPVLRTRRLTLSPYVSLTIATDNSKLRTCTSRSPSSPSPACYIHSGNATVPSIPFTSPPSSICSLRRPLLPPHELAGSQSISSDVRRKRRVDNQQPSPPPRQYGHRPDY